MIYRIALVGLASAAALAAQPTPNPQSRVAPRAEHVASTGVTGSVPTNRHWSQATSNGSSMFVFAGRTGTSGSGSKRNDLYEFDALTKTWTQHNADGDASAPPRRFRNTAAWDETNGVLVVFGGEDAAAGTLGDTWVWSPGTNTWTDMTPATSPTPRKFASMTYDPITTGIVLYGGQDSTGAALDDTWLWIGNSWLQVVTANSPGVRAHHSLVTRSDFGDVLLCAGLDNGASPNRIHYTDVWTFDGGNWNLITPTTTAVNASMAGNQAVYDSLRQRVVLQGGQGISTNSGATGSAYGTEYGGSPSSWCSEFDCVTNEWKLYGLPAFGTADPVIGRASRYYSAFLVDRIWFWGGQNPSGTGVSLTSMKEYQADPLASVSVYGSPCTNSMAGSVSLTAGGAPWTCRSVSATTDGLLTGSIGAVLFGFTQVALPLDLVFPASAGCEFLVDTVVANFPLVPSGGMATTTLPIPDSPSLAGLMFNLQAFQIETSPSLFLSASNGLAFSVGAN